MKKLFTILAMCFAFVAVNAQTATIVLDVQTSDAEGLWGDGTGYQLLLSPTNTDTSAISAMYCGWDYDSTWTYKIPANASGYTWNTSVIMGQQSMTVPAGEYGYVVYNPSCIHPDTVEAYAYQNWLANDSAYQAQGYATYADIHDDLFAYLEQYFGDNYYYVVYIAGSGTASGKDVLNFEAGKVYTFSIEMTGTGDAVNLTVTGENPETGIAENAASFGIYPNPANDVLNITANDVKNIEILNMLGQTVATTNVSTVNVSNLTEGVYFVRVNFNNGKVATQKFVKE